MFTPPLCGGVVLLPAIHVAYFCNPAYLKKPLQPSQVMALKWKPVALSPHTPQMRGTFLSNSSGARVEVLTAVDSITRRRKEGYEKRVQKNK
jgi:hypothetical protein